MKFNQTIQATNQITGKQKWWALATVLLTMFFSSMNQTVVSTAIPTIIGDLQGFELYAWLFSAYMITSAITVPIYGKLSDVYGRRPFYIFGLIMFMIGSAISGQASSMLELVIARGVQGIGAGAMMSMPRATIGDIFNPKERGKWMGVIGAVFGLSSILGPVIGGWITDTISWRWVFYVNIPVGIIALIGVIFTLPRVRTSEQKGVDWFGSVLLTIGLVPILLAFTWAGTKYAWTDVMTISLFVVGLVFLALFIIYEKRAKEAIIEPALFKNQIFSMSLILGVFVGMAMFGSIMFLPLFIQGVVGLSAQNSGLVMSPMMISFIIGSIVAGGLMSKTGKYRKLAHFSGATIVLGTVLLMSMNVDTTFPTVMFNMIILGLGIGSLMPLLNVAVQNAFPYRMMGTVNATQQFVQSLSGVIAAPIFGSILNKGFQSQMAESMPDELGNMTGDVADLDPQTMLTEQAQAAIAEKFEQFGQAGQAMYEQLLHAVKVSLTTGISHLFLVGLIFAVLCFIGTFFLPEKQLQEDNYYENDESAS